MIKKLLLSVTLLGCLLIFTSSQFSDDGKAGKTNSPGETTCVNSCHSTYALNAGPGSITITSPGMPSFVYTPGQTYDVTVTVAQNGYGLFGMGLEALFSSGDNAGTFTITDPVATRIRTATVNSVVRNNVTHQLNGGVSTNSKNFNFRWTAPPAGSGNVTFYFSGVAANANGNPNNDYVYNSSQVATESCAAPVQPGAISGSPSLCSGSDSQYSIAPVSGATSYAWSLPSGWSGSSTTETITVTAGATSGDISVSANNSCGISQAQSLTVTGHPLPAPVITIINSTSDTLYCNTNWPCQWYRDGYVIPGATNTSFVPVQNGIYTISVTDPNGCIGISADFPYNTTGISQFAFEEQITVYPSPASNYIYITVAESFFNQDIIIRDIRGSIVSNNPIREETTKIDLTGISEGVYFAVIGNGDNRSVRRFFIQR